MMVGLTIEQCFSDLVHAAQVCPAGWNPGSKSMKGDHIGSQEYFGSVGEEAPQLVDFGPPWWNSLPPGEPQMPLKDTYS